MTAKVRARLFQAFIVLFITLTVITSLYAAGYRLNFSRPFSWTRLLQKTGMLYVSTKPNDAQIYLDKHQKSIFFHADQNESIDTTPAKITNLMPGKYDLTLNLEGYWPWEKEIDIHPGKAIYFEDIDLFKKTLPLLIKNVASQDITFSPNNRYVFLSQDKIIIDLKTEKTFALPEDEISNWQWSSNDEQFITDKYIYKPASEDLSWLSTDEQINNLKCFKNNKQVFFQNQNSINQFSLSSQDIDIIAPHDSCHDYFIYGNKLLTINTADQKTIIKVSSLKGEQLNTIELPYSDKYKFLDLGNSYINVWQEDHQTLYVIDEKEQYQPIKAKINNLQNVIWLGGDQLLYSNDVEIMLYDLKLSQNSLVTRVSTPITDLLWHPGNNYIIFSSSDSLYIIDWQKRDYTITKIITLKQINSISLDSKKDQVYFMGEVGQQSGIYKLSL